jgi:DNA-binding NarL/FixJ family response regulator
MEKIRLFIADDSAPFRDGLRTMLETVQDIEVVGEATTGTEAVTLVASLQPDVILMDIQMPNLNGIEATRDIVGTSPHISILILTMFDDDDSVFAALRAGARGYLLKGALKAEILRVVRGAAAGDAIFGSTIARRLLRFLTAERPTAHAQLFPDLTERELEILTLIAQHHTNPEIARRLGLSPKTIRNNVSNIFSKIQVADRAEAIMRAREAGLGG